MSTTRTPTPTRPRDRNVNTWPDRRRVIAERVAERHAAYARIREGLS